jgi:hypothetical protein
MGVHQRAVSKLSGEEKFFSVIGRFTKLKKFNTFISDCRTLNNDRVRVAHGLWVIANENGVLQHVSRQELQFSLHFKEPTVLAGLADKAALLRFKLAQIFPGRRR